MHTHHHHLLPHSDFVALGPVLEPDPESEADPNLGPQPERESAVAVVAVHVPAIVYMIVATPAVEKVACAKCIVRQPA